MNPAEESRKTTISSKRDSKEHHVSGIPHKLQVPLWHRVHETNMEFALVEAGFLGVHLW